MVKHKHDSIELLPAVQPLPTAAIEQFTTAAADARNWLEQAATYLQQADAFNGDVAMALTKVNDHLLKLEQSGAVLPHLLTGLHAALTTLTEQRNKSVIDYAQLKERVTREVEVAYSEGMVHVFECGDCAMAAEREADVEHLAQLISEEGEEAIAKYQKEAAERIEEARKMVAEDFEDGKKPEFLVDSIDKKFVAEHTDFDEQTTLGDFYGDPGDFPGDDDDESEDFDDDTESDDDED